MNVLKRSLYLFAHNLPRLVVLNNCRFIYSVNRPLYLPITFNNGVSAEFCRNYSKAKDRGKDKKKSTGKVEINTAQLSRFLDLEKVKREYEEILDNMKEEFTNNLTLRSSVGAIETLKVPYEGKTYELQELSQIVRKNPKTVILNMASIPQVIPEVLKAIQNSGLNVNPQQDGTTVFIPVPKVTKEHRENLTKSAKVIFNARKSDMKQIPLKCFRKLKLVDSSISEDMLFAVRKQVNAMCDTYVDNLRVFYENKVKELGGSGS